VRRRFRLRHAAALVAALGGLASALAILVLSARADDLSDRLEELCFHRLTRETLEEAADVVDVARRTEQGGPQ
jgi:hypothetical protein